MEKIIEIRIITKAVKIPERKLDFTAYTAVQKDGKLIRCKFTKKCKEEIKIPEYDVDCFTIAVKPENVAFEKNTIYPTIWVKKVENVIEAKFKEETLADYDEDKLPF